jgi:DNA-binding SARP family transcriptional activator
MAGHMEGEMFPVLQVQLLGNFQLQYEGQTLTAISSQRIQTLLAYVILQRCKPVSRQQVAALFWPDTSEAQARTNLRNLIHQLRQVFPCFDDFIQVDTSSLMWRKGSSYILDVDSFENCFPGKAGQPLQQDMLEQALRIYSGDLLPDCYDDWIEPIRACLRRMYLSALGDLATMAEEARDFPTALTYARRLVAVDPLLAAANCQLIRLHMLVGDRVAACKAYQSYARLLWQELKLEPEAELQDVFHLIQSSCAPPTSFRNSTPLVGRKNEWHEILTAWKSATAGHVQVLLITGEAGIGKTRLVEELVHWADLQGILTATAFCYPAEGNLPFAPIVSWLRTRPLPHLEKVWLTEIARLLPEIRQNHSGQPKSENLHEGWQRQHLFDALAHAFMDRKQAQILVIEDIHWCDQDTLDWLHYLMRFTPKAPLLIIATVRNGEVLADHPVHHLQATLRSDVKFMELRIKPLNEGETAQLANCIHQQISTQNLSTEEMQQIYQEAEGNPLFTVEMVRLGATKPCAEPSHENGLLVSDRVQSLLLERIGQVSVETREIVCLAATIGREFNLDVLRIASQESDESIVSSIDELLQRCIIREITPEIYDFTHDLLRQAAFTGMSMAHLRLLHRRVAEAYQQLNQAELHPRNAEIASHYELAGMPVQACRHYGLAAETAAHTFANADAIRYFGRAVEMAEGCGTGVISSEEYAHLLERQGDVLALVGKVQQAQNCFERALAQPFPASGIWRAGIYQKICDSLVPQYKHALAHAALDQSEKALGPGEKRGSLEEVQEWLQIQLSRIQLYYWEGRPEEMEGIIQKIRSDIEALGRMDQQTTLLSLQYMARQRRERYRLSAETVGIGRRRLELAEKYSGPFDQARAKFQYGFGLLWYGDLIAARDWLALSLEATSRIGARIWQVRSLAYLSITDRKLGNLAEVDGESRQLLDLCHDIGDQTYYGMGLANLGWLAWRMGDWERAITLCREGNQVWEKSGSNVFHCLTYWVLLAIAVAQHDLHQAAECARVLLDPNPFYQPVPVPTAKLLQQAISAYEDENIALEGFKQALEEARAAREL